MTRKCEVSKVWLNISMLANKKRIPRVFHVCYNLKLDL